MATKTTSKFQQYLEQSVAFPGVFLLFRTDDFYECFGEDAAIGASVCGLTITTMKCHGIETKMAGFPSSLLNDVLRSLVAAGHRVALLEQSTRDA